MNHLEMIEARQHTLHAQCAALAGYPDAALSFVGRARAALAELPARFADPCGGAANELLEAEAALRTGEFRAAVAALDAARRLVRAVDEDEEPPPSGTRPVNP